MSDDDHIPEVVPLEDIEEEQHRKNKNVGHDEPIWMTPEEILQASGKELTTEQQERLKNQLEQRERRKQQLNQRLSEEEEDEEYHADTVTAILIPVSITMILAVTGTLIISTDSPRQQVTQFINVASGNSSQSSLSLGTQILIIIVSAVAVLVGVLLTTITFVILYKYRCMKVIFGWLMTSVFTMLSMFGGIFIWYAFDALQWTVDYITLAFFLWNFGVVGVLAVFWHAPTKVNQMYLIFISALLAIFFSFASTAIVIGILLTVAIYDIFAVLCPNGPLKVLVETAQERRENIPALVFNASVFIGMADQERYHQGTKRRGIKLGLGDFVFYSVLISLAAQYTLGVVFSCFIAILTGLFVTLLLLAIAQQALPALPISIFLGVVFYFLSVYFHDPFVIEFGKNGVFV